MQSGRDMLRAVALGNLVFFVVVGSLGCGGEASAPAPVAADLLPAEAAAPSPPIDPTLPSRAPALCDQGAAPTAYLLAHDGTLFKFDPGSLETRALGVVPCATDAALSVTASGTGYVLNYSGGLYEVDLTTVACQTTAFQPGQLGLVYPVSVSVGANRTADRLYYAYVVRQSSTLHFGLSDLSTSPLLEVGPITPDIGAEVAMTSDAYGRIFALGADGALWDLDPTTGAVLGEDHTGFDGTSGYAMMSYDGSLYFFGGLGGVSRYDLATKALFPMGQVNQDVTGASAMPCLSAAALPPPELDGGDDGEADAGAPATPFSAGDAWMGTYACAGGLTKLAVAIEAVDGDAVTARFDFGSVDDVTQGSYELTGTFDPTTREATFSPGPWISQTGSGVYPVGMDGYVDLSGTSYSGSITSTGCGAFSVAR